MVTLILYTRVGCCLCAGLEERLKEVLPAASFANAASEDPSDTASEAVEEGGSGETPEAVVPTLARIRLRPVDVDSDPALQARYGLSVPVLALANARDGVITPLPPVSPRLQGEPLRSWLLRHLAP